MLRILEDNGLLQQNRLDRRRSCRLVGCVPAAWELAGGPEEGGGFFVSHRGSVGGRISVWGRESRGEPQRSLHPQPVCDSWVKLRTAREGAGALRLQGKVLEASPCRGDRRWERRRGDGLCFARAA